MTAYLRFSNSTRKTSSQREYIRNSSQQLVKRDIQLIIRQKSKKSNFAFQRACVGRAKLNFGLNDLKQFVLEQFGVFFFSLRYSNINYRVKFKVKTSVQGYYCARILIRCRQVQYNILLCYDLLFCCFICSILADVAIVLCINLNNEIF